MDSKKSNAIKSLVLPALCLFLVCLITTTMLAFTNQATYPVIAENTRKEAERLYREVLPKAESFESKKVELDGQSYDVQVGKAGGKDVGYVMQTQHNGYAGPVVCLTGIDAEGKILGVRILSMNETAGLGMNAGKPEFLNQYNGKSSLLQVVKNEVKGDDQILAVSGATITSNAVTQSVNTALKIFKQVSGGAKGGK